MQPGDGVAGRGVASATIARLDPITECQMLRATPLVLVAVLLAACATPPPFEASSPPPPAAPPAGFDAASLAGSVWILEEIRGIRVAPELQAKLQFVSTTEVAGFGSCNSFTGPVKIGGDGIAFGMLAQTRKACAEMAMVQEARYLGALKAARQAKLENGQLVLVGEDGRALLLFKRGE